MSEHEDGLSALLAPVERRFSGMSEPVDDLPPRGEVVKLFMEPVEPRFSGSFERLEALRELLHPGKPRFSGMELFLEVLS